MPYRTPIAYIDIRVIAHATEDLEKVIEAVHNTLPKSLLNSISFKKTLLKGHYKNQIMLIQARIRDKEKTKSILEKLGLKMSATDKATLNSSFEAHLDKGDLYIRLDKQSSYLSKIMLSPNDSIRMRVHFTKSNLQELKRICRDAGIIQ